jgi:AmmeMemoRadiSam system protein B
MAIPLPRLRAVDVTPIEHDSQQAYVLRDRDEPESRPIVLNAHGLLLASLLDGERDAAAVRTAFMLRTAQDLTTAQIHGFVAQLESANLVESPAYLERRRRLLKAFRNADEREAIHAGGAYPRTREELVPYLDAFFLHPDGPGSAPAGTVALPLRALIAPHVDIHRGGPTYSWGYKALAESENPDLYVLLGTCHTEMATPLAATRKPYATPLGPAPADRDFLGTLEGCYDGDLYADELSHRGEHALEFQAVYLRYLGRVGGSGSPNVVSLLCGSLHQFLDGDEPPAENERIVRALSALRETIARDGRRICLIAGADFAHVGPQFGDPEPVTRSFLERVEVGDRAMLERVCAGDADGFYAQVMEDGDARRICGLAPMYYLLALLGPGPAGEVLKYTQWVDERGHGSVTFGSVVFPG